MYFQAYRAETASLPEAVFLFVSFLVFHTFKRIASSNFKHDSLPLSYSFLDGVFYRL